MLANLKSVSALIFGLFYLFLCFFVFKIFKNRKFQAVIFKNIFLNRIQALTKEIKYVAFWNRDLKQLSDCSHSDQKKYTESRMKENVLEKKYSRDTWFKLLIVQESLSYFIPLLG